MIMILASLLLVMTTTTMAEGQIATNHGAIPKEILQHPCLRGEDLLHGIQAIIGQDPNLPRQELDFKPYVGSFSTYNPGDDLSQVSYCLTDNACGHFEAYSQKGVPLSLLNCNHFCFIDAETHRFVQSQHFTPDNPPDTFLNCGWETCG